MASTSYCPCFTQECYCTLLDHLLKGAIASRKTIYPYMKIAERDMDDLFARLAYLIFPQGLDEQPDQLFAPLGKLMSIFQYCLKQHRVETNIVSSLASCIQKYEALLQVLNADDNAVKSRREHSSKTLTDELTKIFEHPIPSIENTISASYNQSIIDDVAAGGSQSVRNEALCVENLLPNDEEDYPAYSSEPSTSRTRQYVASNHQEHVFITQQYDVKPDVAVAGGENRQFSGDIFDVMDIKPYDTDGTAIYPDAMVEEDNADQMPTTSNSCSPTHISPMDQFYSAMNDGGQPDQQFDPSDYSLIDVEECDEEADLQLPPPQRIQALATTSSGTKTVSVFRCPIPKCGVQFNTQHRALEHIRSVHGVMRYQCTFNGCGSKFARRSALRKHLVCHKEKSLPCEFCGSLFRSQYHLKRHLMVHTGVKPYECPRCDYRARSSNNVKQHVRSKHNEEWVLAS